MPKPRQTCTECSLRRQKCDRAAPRGRCIKRGVAERCTIYWPSTGPTTATVRSLHTQNFEATKTSLLEHTTGSDFNSNHDVNFSGENSLFENTTHLVITDLQEPRQKSKPTLLGNDLQLCSDLTDRLASLQLLLPNLILLKRLVNYHEKRLLWYHGCFHGPTFNAELSKRISAQQLFVHDTITLCVDDLQWFALLFAVLAGSITCANIPTLMDWEVEQEEAASLSRHWHRASTTCLELGQYRSHHQLHGVQAIATLTMCAHTLGRSNEHYVLVGTAIKISQALGLHRLSLGGDETVVHDSTLKVRRQVLMRETGRRLFCQLCVQDWFSIPFAGVHTIHRKEVSTIKPSDRDFQTMEPLQVGEPSYVSYNNYLYEIAALILELHERAIKCNTEFTRYEQVMSIDARMREIAIQARPRYFDVTVPLDRDWPWFIPWARRSLTICFAHKVIIIHRSFLARSFENATFSFSRRTCIAAAKTILSEANQQQDVNEPVIWIDQAFCIAAAITLSVDAIHRHSHELELEVHRKLVQGCIDRLCEYHNSPLAERGVRLLGVLLLISDPTRETNTILQEPRPQFDVLKILAYAYRGPSNDTLHLDAFLSPNCPDSARSGDDVGNEMRTDYHVYTADLVENSVPELFPAQSGFSNAFIFEELLARL